MSNPKLNEGVPKFVISKEAVTELRQKKEVLLDFVNKELSNRKDIHTLIGHNSLSIMHNNHENHINFMINVFNLNNFKLLATILPWVYKTYQNKGFSFDYFVVELNAWIRAITGYISKKSRGQLVPVYEWILENHELLIDSSQQYKMLNLEVPEEWKVKQKEFLRYLLEGDTISCLKMAHLNTHSLDTIQDFLLYVVKASLYEIGELWERGEITEAHEHVATAIVSRVMSYIYTRFPNDKKEKRGRCLITTTSNEFHELGARMVADFLELHGWDVTFVGANVPKEALIRIARRYRPDFIGLSVTMAFNLGNAVELIKTLKNEQELATTKIMVGGIAFNLLEDLAQQIGADLYAPNAKAALWLVESIGR